MRSLPNLNKIILAALVAIFAQAPTYGDEILGIYEFTGGSLVATDADGSDGITLSDMVIGAGYGDLFDNGGDGDSLRISGPDTQNGTGSATSNDAMLSFVLTNNSGSDLILDNISLDYQATNAFNYSSARVFSSGQGFDAIVDDTIGVFGRSTGGSDADVVNDVVSLRAGSAEFGANIVADDFTIADGDSITFFIPWIDASGSDTRFTDVDNIRISAIPEPTSIVILSGVGMLIATRRRR